MSCMEHQVAVYVASKADAEEDHDPISCPHSEYQRIMIAMDTRTIYIMTVDGWQPLGVLLPPPHNGPVIIQ